jgi:hypothetical protein
MAAVGFALWLDSDQAWAAGTYEYRAMGVAVISNTDQFRTSDFQQGRRRPAPAASYAGQFASIGQVNYFLRQRRRRRRGPCS